MVKSSQTKQNESTQTKHKKIRVYELAKQYGVSSKDFVEELREYGILIKNHMSTLDRETVELVETERKATKPPPLNLLKPKLSCLAGKRSQRKQKKLQQFPPLMKHKLLM